MNLAGIRFAHSHGSRSQGAKTPHKAISSPLRMVLALEATSSQVLIAQPELCLCCGVSPLDRDSILLGELMAFLGRVWRQGEGVLGSRHEIG